MSSRSNRNKDSQKPKQQTADDFMDEEDRADAAEAQRVQIAEGYGELGSTQEETARQNLFSGLFKTEGETMGVKLLKKMGWREGQGIGPKVRRKAQLDGVTSSAVGASAETHLFAPENTQMVNFVRKTDHKGLGFEGEAKLHVGATKEDVRSDEDNEGFGTAASVMKPKKSKPSRGGIGIGILNDTGSDDEDPYSIGPRISYSKVIGGEKKKKVKKVLANGAAPVLISKKAMIARSASNLRKCHDGRLPLDGFVLSSDMASLLISDNKYIPPKVPENWQSKMKPRGDARSGSFVSTADAAKASKLDPKSRAALLGEAALPGKSVFDYLSTSARDRLAAASGKTNLPAALGERPEGYNMTPQQQQHELLGQVPKTDKETASAALSRGANFMPFSDDEPKRARYRTYLEVQADTREGLPERKTGMTTADWVAELNEFARCAQIFKPMSGLLASRFASSTLSSKSEPSAAQTSDSNTLLYKPAPKVEDPAEAAAKIGMFGPMTRSSQDFYPTRLLCKRFNVRPPAHVQLDPERSEGDGGGVESRDSSGRDRDLELLGKDKLNNIMKDHWDGVNSQRAAAGLPQATRVEVELPQPVQVEPEINDALEGKRADDAVFKAVFGDSSDEEE